MRDPRRRLEQLEYGRLYQLAAKVGQPYGFSADQVLDEARRVLASRRPSNASTSSTSTRN
jgi:hypothetical protein